MTGLITPEYLALQIKLHAENDLYGTKSQRLVEELVKLAENIGAKTILDYGCGKGRVREAIGERVAEYDPAIEGKNADPEPADLVVCTDVLEHIEPECLDMVLNHLRGKTKFRLYFTIALQPALKTLNDGRNAHLIIEPPEWWHEKISRLFRIVEWYVDEGKQITGLAQPIAVVGEIKSIGVLSNSERNENTAKNVLKTPLRIPEMPVPAHDGVIILACYGPSLKGTLPMLAKQRKQFKRQKLDAKVVSVSGAHDFLRKNGVTPDIHVECDPRPHKSKMVLRPSDKTEYLMASCCDPVLIDRLKNYNVRLWHLMNGADSYKIRDIKTEEWSMLIPGGGSVGLRSLVLFFALGYRHFVIHGMDCSFADDGEQHAGFHSGKQQDMISICVRAPEHIEKIIGIKERWFKTSPVLVTYANHMVKDLREGRYPNCRFGFMGDGLLQQMVKVEYAIAEFNRAKAAVEREDGRDYFNMDIKEDVIA